MTALIIILIFLAALMLLPLGVYVSYTGGGLRVSAHVWLYKRGVYPPKPKSTEPEPTEGEANKNERPKPSLLRELELEDWLRLIKTAFRALRRFKSSVYFELIRLHALISAPDPYDAVMRYNAVNGSVGAMIPFFEAEFRVKERDIYIGLDMEGGESRAEFELCASVRLGSVLALGLAVGFELLKILINNRIRRIRERTARNGKQQTERNDAVDNEQHQGSC